MIPVVGRALNAQRRLAEVRLLLEQAEAVRFVGGAVAAVAVHAHRTVAMVVVERAFGAVHRDLVVVDAQAVAVRIAIGEQAALQHFIRRETDARHHVGGVHRHLLNL